MFKKGEIVFIAAKSGITDSNYSWMSHMDDTLFREGIVVKNQLHKGKRFYLVCSEDDWKERKLEELKTQGLKTNVKLWWSNVKLWWYGEECLIPIQSFSSLVNECAKERITNEI